MVTSATDRITGVVKGVDLTSRVQWVAMSAFIVILTYISIIAVEGSFKHRADVTSAEMDKRTDELKYRVNRVE